MHYLGDYAPGSTVRQMFNTSDSNGASITGSTDGTISVYKDGGTTQSTTGVTSTEDFDALTGVHLVAIDTSADGTFYSTGSDFIVVLSGATIDTRTVNAALFSFDPAPADDRGPHARCERRRRGRGRLGECGQPDDDAQSQRHDGQDGHRCRDEGGHR